MEVIKEKKESILKEMDEYETQDGSCFTGSTWA